MISVAVQRTGFIQSASHAVSYFHSRVRKRKPRAPSLDKLRDKNPPSTGVAFDYQHFRTLCASLPFERSFVRLAHHLSRAILERNVRVIALL
jgi:hypothetical protein